MSFSHRDARHVTSQLIEAADDQMLTWRQLAEAALLYMSEAEVADMAQSEGFLELLEGESDD
jgi:hypothetical protein